MLKNDEVLSFYFDSTKSRLTFLEKLDHFDKAPYCFNETSELKNFDAKLNSFFNRRTISDNRVDIKDILDATGCKSPLELLFKGHGLSLSDHYWFRKENEILKYEDINFFVNKWDDSFARAVISEDYEALKHCNLEVPDIAISGWGVKGWLYTDKGPRLYKIGIDKDHPEEALGEVLASKLCQRILKDGEVLKYDLEKISGKYASVSSPIIGIDEELVPLSMVLPGSLYSLYRQSRTNKPLNKQFLDELEKNGYKEYKEFFIKLSCVRSLCFVSDLHFDNISIIRNINTGKTRIGPIYDLGGAFGSSKSGRELIAKPSKATLMIIYFIFSCLRDDWDYSWYNPDNLIGFEDEIRDILSKGSFYTPELIEYAIEVYHQQKSSLDGMKNKSV